MLHEETIEYLRKLYRKIFDEDAGNSKEFISFVQEQNPHPLRIKIEEQAQKTKNDLVYQSGFANNGGMTQPLIYKMGLLSEFDSYITSYIETYV